MPFESFGMGRDLFNQLNREHDLLDRDFRLFAEECDQMQGVQIFTSAEDAWGGFAAEYVAALRDEYSKTGIMTWGLQDFEKVSRVSICDRSPAASPLGSPSCIFFHLHGFPHYLLFFFYSVQYRWGSFGLLS